LNLKDLFKSKLNRRYKFIITEIANNILDNKLLFFTKKINNKYKIMAINKLEIESLQIRVNSLITNIVKTIPSTKKVFRS
tara:strand:+ start:542 stop:781 length:240 start_codon:yes stop_codon:yes gene_type:complete